MRSCGSQSIVTFAPSMLLFQSQYQYKQPALQNQNCIYIGATNADLTVHDVYTKVCLNN